MRQRNSWPHVLDGLTRNLFIGLVLSILVGGTPAMGQAVCLPLPRLLTMMPMGGQLGTTFDVSVTGEHIDAATALRFSDSGISAVPKNREDGTHEPNVFTVTVADTVRPGVYEAAAIAPTGVSASRFFCVGDLPEIMENSQPGIVQITPDTVANGVVASQAIDRYQVELEAGQRLFVECAAAGIDSRMQPVVAISDADGRDLAVDRRGGVLDFSPSTAGTYSIRVHDLCYRGGPAFFYRLVVRNAGVASEPPRHSAMRGVSAFSWPPNGVGPQAAHSEQEVAGGGVERIELPCDVGGRFYPAGDVDCFEFEATAGDTWWIEVGSERLGAPTKPAAMIVRLPEGQKTASSDQFIDVMQLKEIQAPIKPSSNFYSYDGPPYNAGSPDLLGKFVVEQTGTYRISLRDRFGGTRDEPRSDWRMIIRRAAPDFAVVGWALHMELRNGDRNDLSKPFALRRGATVAIEVATVRRDGFDGPIDLSVEGLPTGIHGQGIQIPAGKSKGLVFLTAESSAVVPPTSLTIVAEATIGGEGVQRLCQIASVAWPVKNHAQEIPIPRLLSDPCVSVSAIEQAPLVIQTGLHDPSAGYAILPAKTNEQVKVPLRFTRNSEFSGGSIRLKAFGNHMQNFPVLEVPLTTDETEATIDLKALNVPPGRHTIAFYGTAIVKYLTPHEKKAGGEDAKKVKTVDTAEIIVSQPFTLIVTPSVEQAQAATNDKGKS